MSLRARLITGLLLVAALGLAAASLATWEAVRSFELSRVDDELQLAQVPVAHELNVAQVSPNAAAAQSMTLMPAGTYGAVVSPSGVPLVWVFPFHGTPAAKPPRIPPAVLTTASAAGPGAVVFSTFASGRPSYRALVRQLSSGAVFVVAVPLSTVEGTLSHLALAELFVGVAALTLVGLVAGRVVGIGLRPLGAIVDTAGAIAAGDLSRRVERDDPRTEVGRLGAALNIMLTQIEASFAAKAAGEERLRRFVADAGHELRTPLTSIRGYAELFRRGASSRPEDLALAMRRIEAEAERMGRLVEDLLLLERLGQAPELKLVEVDLVELARDAVSDSLAVDPDRPTSLHGPPGRLVINADEGRLRQILANLLANARMHTPAMTPVEVRVCAQPDMAIIEVSDAGPGLTEEQSERVFERFYRADPSRSRSAGGSGLGLSIVAAIARAHGGRTAVRSEPGRGTTFRVELPLPGGHLSRSNPPSAIR